MRVLKRLLVFVDGVNEHVGKILCFVLIVIMLIQIMDVVLRYVFNSPTIWAMDLNTMLFTGSSMLAGGYALLHDSHVRVDILYRGFGPRNKAIFELFTMFLAIIAFCFVIWQGTNSFWWAWTTGEHINSYWAPPTWPVKLCLPLGAFLLLIQGVSRWLKLLLTVLGKDDMEVSS